MTGRDLKRLRGIWLARLMFALAATLSGAALTSARADVVVQIDKSSQRTHAICGSIFQTSAAWRRL
jgi:uncharacterized protein (DUF2141 family)